MRLTAPRIPPVADDTATPEQQAVLAPMASRGPVLNVFRMFNKMNGKCLAVESGGELLLVLTRQS